MNRNDYKYVINQIKPDTELQNRLAQGLLHHKPIRIRSKRVVYMAVSLLVVISAGIAIPEIWKSANQTPNAITIPKLELPKKSNASANMIGLIVYKGNIYTQTSTRITPEAAKPLLGDKLGRTKAGIDEWSKQTDYAELASTIGVTDIFSVKGYDSDFRIMSYQEQEGKIFAELYERLNGMTITKGEDLLGKINLKDHVESVRWQDYASWDYEKPQYNELLTDQSLQTFLAALYEAKPIDAEKLYKAGIYDNGEFNQKIMYVKLKDQTEVQLRLFKGNYVKYASAAVFFQMDSAAFSALWERM